MRNNLNFLVSILLLLYAWVAIAGETGGGGTKTEDDLYVGKKPADTPLGALGDTPAATPHGGIEKLSIPEKNLSVQSAKVLPLKGPGAIVVPRENCGTHWTAWVDDPDANVNPCPANCERGERQVLNSRRSGYSNQYQARYQCYLPELVVNQPPGAFIQPVTGTAPRINCGTVWTGLMDDPNADVNPCSKGCIRGELQLVKRTNSNGHLQYDMRYQCYQAEAVPAVKNIDPQKIISDVPGPEITLVKPISMFAIKAEWKPVAGATSYVVKALESGISQSVSSPEYRANTQSGGISGLTPGLPYDVWVEAHYPDKRIGVSTVVRTATLDPVNPSDLTATLAAPGTVRLAWTPIRGAARYMVEGSQLEHGVRTQDATLTINNVPIGRHEWRVIAEYGQGFFNDTHPAVVAIILSTAGTTVTGASADQSPLKAIGNSIGGASRKTGNAVGEALKKTGNAVGEAVKKTGEAAVDGATAVGNAVHDVFE